MLATLLVTSMLQIYIRAIIIPNQPTDFSLPLRVMRVCSDFCVRSKFTTQRQHFEQSPLGISAINLILLNRRGNRRIAQSYLSLRNAAFHVLICAGESWYSCASSASVLRSFNAPVTTSALKLSVCLRLVFFISNCKF